LALVRLRTGQEDSADQKGVLKEVTHQSKQRFRLPELLSRLRHRASADRICLNQSKRDHFSSRPRSRRSVGSEDRKATQSTHSETGRKIRCSICFSRPPSKDVTFKNRRPVGSGESVRPPWSEARRGADSSAHTRAFAFQRR
jgi:hypothetical protein